MRLPELSPQQKLILAGIGSVLIVLAALFVARQVFVGGGEEPDEVATGEKPKGDGKKALGDDKKGKADDKKKNDKKKKEEPPPEFDPPRVTLAPNDLTGSGFQGLKPGHWTVATVELKANNRDWNTELFTSVLAATNGKVEVVPLDRSPFYLQGRQPGILPKSQRKYIDVNCYAPPLFGRNLPRLQVRVTDRGGGEVLSVPSEVLSEMPAHQYYLVGLAKNPKRYTFFKTIDCVNPPPGDFAPTGQLGHYRVALPVVDKRTPLPAHLLAWTSIAYVVWDDISPSVLSQDQQTALVDWLHFGGQLIISGPDSLATLQQQGVFLEPYLPAIGGDARKITKDDLAELSQYWSFPAKSRAEESPRRVLQPVESWAGITLQPRPEALPVRSTGNLVYERQIGRGRIVVTAFRLTQPELQNWRGFDNFVNAVLLRREPRSYVEATDAALPPYSWADKGSANVEFNDPRRTTKFRLLSRDFGYEYAADLRSGVGASESIDTYTPATPYGPNVQNANPSLHGQGLGAWSDFNSVATQATQSLREAAGIEIPQANFVFWSVIVYLFVLVPANWLFFKLIGRVEWAWIAAPLIAIVGTVAVTKLAHLDIGFTRSEREIAIVELQPNHPRGHVTRYTAHYTSLSSNYDFVYDDAGTQALPLANDSFKMLIGQSLTPVEYRREEKTRMTGFSISSNSTGMVHTEQVLDFGGGLSYSTTGSRPQVTNGTKLNLRDVGVLRRKLDGYTEIARLPTLAAGATESLSFAEYPAKIFSKSQGETENSPTSPPQEILVKNANPLFLDEVMSADRNDLWARGLVLKPLANAVTSSEILVDPKTKTPDAIQRDKPNQREKTNTLLLSPGKVCLLAWAADPLPGVTTDPDAPQKKHASLVVAHLKYPPWPAASTDVNSKPADKYQINDDPPVSKPPVDQDGPDQPVPPIKAERVQQPPAAVPPAGNSSSQPAPSP